MRIRTILNLFFFSVVFFSSGCNLRLEKTGSEMTIELGVARTHQPIQIVPVNVDGQQVTYFIKKGNEYGSYQIWSWRGADGWEDSRYGFRTEPLRELREGWDKADEPEHRSTVAGSGNHRDT